MFAFRAVRNSRDWARCALLAFCLPGVFATCAVAQSPATQAQTVRYHFGDDPDGKLGWAEAKFDDRAWPVGQNGRWPIPTFNSDGFVWVRVRIPVPGDAAGRLAIRSERPLVLDSGVTVVADELFVNGVKVAHKGRFPPHGDPSLYGWDEVFDLPAGLASPGATAVVAFRVWCPPYLRLVGSSGAGRFTIDESRNLNLARDSNIAASLVANEPDLLLNGLIILLGVGLLLVWYWVGGRDLLLCSFMLILLSLFSLWRDPSFFALTGASWRPYQLVYHAIQLLAMAVTIEFVWAVHGLRARPVKRLNQLAVAIFNLASVILYVAMTLSPIVPWSVAALKPALLCCIFLQIGINLWALIFRRSNRLIAVALISIPVSILLFVFVKVNGVMVGPFYETYFGLAYFVCEFALFVMLGQRAWQSWRARDELRVEFEAAREMQEQLVAPAVDVPGFKIESVYAPAKQVGGDFFRVIPASDDGDGSLLLVVGDVSGKGLKAAMTVSAIMGALAGCDSRGPAKVLEYLNRVLYGRVGGFVTCCAAFIAADGMMTLANAGNPAPYRNGEEMAVEPGLPLGMLAGASYAETRYQIAPSDRLTFVSDGVVEATNSHGQLYGFERTQAVSNQSAEFIADAAKKFGQEDDITVLTVMLTPQGKEVAA